MLNEDISHNNRLLKSAYKKLGRNTAIGLAGTGLSVLGVNKLKNRNKK